LDELRDPYFQKVGVRTFQPLPSPPGSASAVEKTGADFVNVRHANATPVSGSEFEIKHCKWQ